MKVKSKIKRTYSLMADDIVPLFEWECKLCKATNSVKGSEVSDYDKGFVFTCGLCAAKHILKA